MYLLEAKKKAEREGKRLDKQRAQKEAHERAREGTKLQMAEKQRGQDEQRRRIEKQEEADLERAIEASKRQAAAQPGSRSRHNSEASDRPRAGSRSRLQSEQDRPRANSRSRLQSEQDRPNSGVRTPQRVSSSSSQQPMVSGSRSDLMPASQSKYMWQDVQVACKYVGTFEVGKGNIDSVAVKRGVSVMSAHTAQAREAVLIVCLEGLKVVDGRTDKVAMAHALSRVSMCSVDPKKGLFGFVAKNPGVQDKFCHVFAMRKQRHADEMHALVSKAFKLAFTKVRTLEKDKPSKQQQQQQQPPRQSSQPSAPPKAQAQPQANRGQRRNWAKHNPLQGMATLSGTTSKQMESPAARTQTMSKIQAAPSARVATSKGVASVDNVSEAAWYQAGIPREIAMELLNQSEEGAFIVRDSQSQPGNFALTMKANNMMHHFIIRSVSGGFILGAENLQQQKFPDLGSLIVFYSSSTGGALPVTLSLASFNTLFEAEDDEDEGDDSFVDPDYESMKNLREMMAAVAASK